jgi:hypothetical protein
MIDLILFAAYTMRRSLRKKKEAEVDKVVSVCDDDDTENVSPVARGT